MDSTTPRSIEGTTDGDDQKKPYAAPRLIVHGSIAKITQGAKAGSTDVGGLTATGL